MPSAVDLPKLLRSAATNITKAADSYDLQAGMPDASADYLRVAVGKLDSAMAIPTFKKLFPDPSDGLTTVVDAKVGMESLEISLRDGTSMFVSPAPSMRETAAKLSAVADEAARAKKPAEPPTAIVTSS